MSKTTPRTDGVPAQSSKRFELPSLNFSFGSLTEGTDIPPPLPSPVQEVPTPPKTPTEEDVLKKGTNGTSEGHANGLAAATPSEIATTTIGGTKRSAEEGPASPTESTGRGSLRRYLSKTLLSNTYEEQASTAQLPGAARPPSRTASTMTDRKSKRSSSWFRRLRSSDPKDSKRNSVQLPLPEVKKGPPPPMIPELSTWESKVDTAMGDDLFKEIK